MLNKPYIIYKFTNKTNNKIYIGVTNRGLKIRLYEHILASTKNPKFQFHQAIKKYGINNFDVEILVNNVNTKDHANQLEIYYIKYYDTYVNGYNMTEGGGNRGKFNHTDESKLKMSKAKIGTNLNQEHKDKIAKALTGKPKSKKHNLKVALANIGKHHSQETLNLISRKLKGKFSKDKNPAAIVVKIYDNNGNLKFECNGNFEYLCNENGLPTKALRKSYYSSGKPIYQSNCIKKEVLIKNKVYIGWYAIKS